MPREPGSGGTLQADDGSHSDFTTDHKDSDWGGGNHGDLGPGHIDMAGFKLTGARGLGLKPVRRRAQADSDHADFKTDHKDADWGGGNHGDLAGGHIDMPFKAIARPGRGGGTPRSASAEGDHADFKTDHKDSDWGGTHGDLGPGHIDMAGLRAVARPLRRRRRRGDD